jgi:hypothetical protein
MKRKVIISLILAVSIASCKTNADTDTNTSNLGVREAENILVNGIEYSVAGLTQCNYPGNDPMIEKKRNKKLVIIRMQIHCIETTSRNEIAPLEAELIDSRGNSYTTSPAVIAIAQNNGCIKGDDIKGYNAIWNGELKKGETATAYVLGFEIPGVAMPEKLYWNNEWKNKDLFFLLE